MKAKIFLSSILTIALCLSLIVGSTFALFETEKTVNIAVTAGKVDIQANIPNDPEKFKPSIYAGNNNATINGNTVTINNFLPKDSVSFVIEVENKSNVPVWYKVSAKSTATDANTDLLNVLKCDIEVNGKTDTMKAHDDTFNTDYIKVDSGTELTTIKVTLSFPVFNGDVNSEAYKTYQSYQGKSAAISFLVEAVQGSDEKP